MTDNTILFAGSFGFAQLSMRDVGLLNKDGSPAKKKKHMTAIELDGMGIYIWLSDKLKEFDGNQIRVKASVVDGMVKKLFNEKKIINNYLLSLYILREWLDNDGGRFEQDMMLPKINRIVAAMDEEISDGRFDSDIKKVTRRVADNIYRQWSGKPQITDDIRDLNSKRFMRNIA